VAVATRYKSVADMFVHRVRQTPDADAFYYPSGGGWATLKWKDVGERVRRLACGLRALGLQDEERVAILSNTRVEWLLADLAINCAGGAATTIYPSNTPDECAYILSDSRSVVAFAEDDKQVAKLASRREEMPALEHVVTFDGKANGDWVLTLADLEERGRAWDQAHPGEYDAIVGRIEATWLSTLIYTSGTTGKPKGVELPHDCWLYTSEAIDETGLLSASDKQYLWLPLSHSFGKVLEMIQVRLGIPTAVDGRVDKIVENLAVIQPTYMAAAPRIFEKVYNKVVAGAKDGGGAKYAIFKWAIGVGREVSKLRQQKKQPSGLLAIQYAIANKLVFSKLKQRFGGKIRFFISGSAPLAKEIAEFFHAADLLILEGYGLTESSAASFVNRPDDFKFGSVGPPVPHTQVKIAEDGEILIKSRGVMRGYHGLPEATAECLTPDGWLKTGDIGELTPDGHLKITDRKKDLIKTSGGKYVAPQELENRFKTLCPLAGYMLVHGNRRNFITALITLEPEAAAKWAAENGLAGKSPAELVKDERLRAYFKQCVDDLNTRLAKYETIKKFEVLADDFTVESGLLTPSLKVKRKAVEERYKDVLDGFYHGATEEV
jgi:long-chain acyl-CoA synthetase